MRYQKRMIALALAGLAFNTYAGGGGDYDRGDDHRMNLSRSTSFSESSADAWAKADAESNARANIDGSGNSKSYSGVDGSGNSKSYSGVDGSGNSKSQSGVDRSGNSRSNSNVEGSGNSKVNASGGKQRQSQGQSVRTGGNKTNVNVSGAGGDGSGGDSFSARTTVWAPVIHGPAAAPLAGANIVMNPRPCGPRVNVASVPVVGKRFGAWGGIREVEQGITSLWLPRTSRSCAGITWYSATKSWNMLQSSARAAQAASRSAATEPAATERKVEHRAVEHFSRWWSGCRCASA